MCVKYKREARVPEQGRPAVMFKVCFLLVVALSCAHRCRIVDALSISQPSFKSAARAPKCAPFRSRLPAHAAAESLFSVVLQTAAASCFAAAKFSRVPHVMSSYFVLCVELGQHLLLGVLELLRRLWGHVVGLSFCARPLFQSSPKMPRSVSTRLKSSYVVHEIATAGVCSARRGLIPRK